MMQRLRNGFRWWHALVALATAAGLAIGAVVLYVQVIRDDAPPPLTFSESAAASDAAAVDAAATSLEGAWTAAATSEVGYRVKENFVGGLQNAEAVGRTSSVTGELVASGSTIDSVELTADLATLESDDGRRDGQVRGRLLETDQFPNATFTLSEALDASGVSSEPTTWNATGQLTLHGVTKDVGFELRGRLNGAAFEVSGAIPIVFADYGIDNPSNPFVEAEDNGLLEFLVVFERAS